MVTAEGVGIAAVRAPLRHIQRGYPGLAVRFQGDDLGNIPLLFLRTALEEMLAIDPLLEGDKAYFGRHAIDLFFSRNRATPLAMMLLSTDDAEARALSLELLRTRIMDPLAAWLGGPDGEEKAGRLHLLWLGFITCWRLLPLPEIGAERDAPTWLWLERATQAIVDEPSATP